MTRRIKISEAAKAMEKSEQFVRIGLQRGVFPFGVAIKTSSKWSYYINPSAFEQYIGGYRNDSNKNNN